jgi:hypothetical protein
LAARGYQGETPVARRRLSVPERVVAFLRGDCEFRGEGFRHVAAIAPVVRVEPSPAIGTLRGMMIAGEHPIVVVGPALIGKLTAIAAAAAELSRPVLAAELEGLLATSDPVAIYIDMSILTSQDGLSRIQLVSSRRSPYTGETQANPASSSYWRRTSRETVAVAVPPCPSLIV